MAFADPKLSSLIKTANCRLSDISDHHSYGYCGSAHLFRFQYADDSDIRQIVTANDLDAVQIQLSAEQMGGPPDGQSIAASAHAMWDIGGEPKWRTYAPNWHQIPPAATVFHGGVIPNRRTLYVDSSAKTAYLQVELEMP